MDTFNTDKIIDKLNPEEYTSTPLPEKMEATGTEDEYPLYVSHDGGITHRLKDELCAHCTPTYTDDEKRKIIKDVTPCVCQTCDCGAIARAVEEERERIKKVAEGLKTDERKAAVFGKGMDSWEARTYDEKQLVNAVLKDLIKKI